MWIALLGWPPGVKLVCLMLALGSQPITRCAAYFVLAHCAAYYAAEQQ